MAFSIPDAIIVMLFAGVTGGFVGGGSPVPATICAIALFLIVINSATCRIIDAINALKRS